VAAVTPLSNAAHIVGDGERPVVVVGAHGQSLFMRVESVPRQGETVLGSGYTETMDGGKATNQAVAAARLGAPVRFVSVVGNDERGMRVLRYLDTQAVDRRWVRVVDGQTDVGFVMLPPSGIPAIASCSDLAQRLDGSFVRLAADALHGANTVVCQLEAPEACALEAFRLGRATGARTVLNPAPAANVSPDLLALSDVIVPNEHEAAAIVGREASVRELAARLSEMAPAADVIVTAGGDGAYLARAGRGVVHIVADPARPVDTTGAGDALVGALAARLRAGDPIEEATRYAVRAATISVTRPGTMEAFADAADVAAERTGDARTTAVE
jgi:ribokinase